ncbi:MAG TPA: GspMb/PilO family protein [Vicinamibacterales bacterium]|nr:GspMb/PilO family protein [Vicinamibacterales bacterium]
MKALFTFGAEVPLSRVIADHRRWLLPAGILLAINLVVLVAVVLPLRQSVQSGAARAEASAVALREAMADLKDAEATRDGQSKAAVDLDRFYADVLPKDFMTARRVTHIKLAQLARSHDVTFVGGEATTEELQDSVLERLHVNYSLSGDWEDIRQFLYAIETGPDFVVIDNMQLGEAATSGSLALTLDLSTYYRRMDAQGALGPRGADGR